MSKVLTSVLVVFGFTVVLSLPAKRSPFTMGLGDLEHTRQLPGRVREFDMNGDGALDMKELEFYFKSTFDDVEHISQNVREVFYVLDTNGDRVIDGQEIEPLHNL
ncbi:uncharacterized protein LOC143077950 [Mytilus galloprovincialis]|uniref:uncharacterized protein LOC143077950 n=1 Tax=Mytilus galloprovincialis TaxID=29158 RepID=UPI003F7C6675